MSFAGVGGVRGHVDWIDLLQWPGMAASLAGAYLLGSQDARTRIIGFVVFCTSNVLWTVWGFSEQAWALITLQVGLFILNVRGIRRNEDDVEAEHPELAGSSLVDKVTADA